MKRTTWRAAAPAAAALSIALVLSACGAGNEEPGDDTESTLSGTLNGAGASAQQAAVNAWKQGFQTSNPDVTVNYDPIGSGGGREQFLSGGTSFAGSDAYLKDEELALVADRCAGSDVVEIPVYVSPIAVIYNLDGVDTLNLSPATLGSIFNGDITTWNDPAIARDNPDADLPSTTITPVHRSDDSGTTDNFTDYLEAASGGTWPHEADGEWPIEGGEAAQGTSGVVDAVSAGQGTIGYADASQAGELGTAAIKVGDSFVEYSPEAAAATLDASDEVEGRADTDIAIEIDRTIDAEGVYPIILVSYGIACQQYADEAEADLVKAWFSYIASAEGQQASAEGAGSAPLSPALTERALAAIETISAG